MPEPPAHPPDGAAGSHPPRHSELWRLRLHYDRTSCAQRHSPDPHECIDLPQRHPANRAEPHRNGTDARERQFLLFGKLFSVSVDGKVDAQPLYVSQLNMPGQGSRAVTYVATEHDSVYALDAANGVFFWR